MAKTKKEIISFLSRIACMKDDDVSLAKQFAAIKVLVRYDKEKMIEKLEEMINLDNEKSVYAADLLLRIIDNDKPDKLEDIIE